MFLDFLLALRRQGLPLGTQEWIALHEALSLGLVRSEEELYGLGRALLVHSEAHYDAFDVAFLEVFHDVQAQPLAGHSDIRISSPWTGRRRK